MTTQTRRFDQAALAAAEFRALTTRGDLTRADQIERTIDELVGTRRQSGGFWWPTRIASIAGVSPRRSA